MKRNRATVVAGFAGSFVVLGILLAFVGVERVLSLLAEADPGLLLLAAGFGAGWLTAWGLALYVVLGSLDAAVSRPTAVLLYAAAAFANNVTPFGQAGGEPVTALVIERVTRTDYRTGLVSIASVDALNVVSSLSCATVGFLYYATTRTIGPQLQVIAAVTVAVSLGFPMLSYLTWRRRRAIAEVVTVGMISIASAVSRVVSRVDADEARIRNGIDNFVTDIERLGTSSGRLGIGFCFSALGWLCQVAILYTAFRALGHGIDPIPLLFVIPVANVAGFAPLPGGIGSIESAFVGLLVLVTGYPVSVATTAVLVHRAIVYWLPTAIGAVVTITIGGQRLSETL